MKHAWKVVISRRHKDDKPFLAIRGEDLSARIACCGHKLPEVMIAGETHLATLVLSTTEAIEKGVDCLSCLTRIKVLEERCD